MDCGGWHEVWFGIGHGLQQNVSRAQAMLRRIVKKRVIGDGEAGSTKGSKKLQGAGKEFYEVETMPVVPKKGEKSATACPHKMHGVT